MDYKSQRRTFIKTIQGYLDECVNATSDINKAAIATKVFDYIVENKHMFDYPEWEKFKRTILGKLWEFRNEKHFNSDKYMQILFLGNTYIDEQSIKQEDVAPPILNEPVENIVEPKKIIPEIIEDYKNTKPIQIIFEDYKLNKLINIGSFTNVEITNEIIKFITEKYENSTRFRLVTQLINTIEEIKNNTEYPNGPFLQKINDSTYELYEKITEEKKSGYLWTKVYNEPSINKVGRFCQVF
jgi:hypothetical protein